MSHSVKTEMRGGRRYGTENLSNLRPDDEIGALLQQLQSICKESLYQKYRLLFE